MAGHGTIITTAGQIGWNAQGQFPEGLVPQIQQALENVLAVLAEANATATDIASMTWFITDLVAYRNAGPALAPIWRTLMGRHYPAMAVIGVTALVEPQACVEIQATAIIAEGPQ